MMFNLKKKSISNKNSLLGSKKLLRALLIAALVVPPFQVSFAQLTISLSNSNLGTVIKQIKAQSNYRFFYDDELAAIPVASLKVSNSSLTSVLDKALSGKGITYRIDDNVVYLSRTSKEKTTEPRSTQQQKTVSGKITDLKGEPLIGVTVLEKGTTNGTITDFDGNYSLSLSNPNAVLQFSYVGYKSIELVANNRC